MIVVTSVMVAGAQPALFMTARAVNFRAEPGRTYRLLYGNGAAAGPQYDLQRLFDLQTKAIPLDAGFGPEEPNTAYADPRPWTERHPVVLWIALGIAVVVLGLSALRALTIREKPSP